MRNKRYILSMGHDCKNDTHMIVNMNAYEEESEVLAEFADFDMAKKFIDTIFIPIKNKKGEYKYSIYKNEKKRNWTALGFKQLIKGGR